MLGLFFDYALAIMHSLLTLPALLFCTASLASDYLRPLPSAFKPQNESKWAWISYESPSVAVLPGSFNRSVFEAPYVAMVSDGNVKQAYGHETVDLWYLLLILRIKLRLHQRNRLRRIRFALLRHHRPKRECRAFAQSTVPNTRSTMLDPEHGGVILR